MALSHIGRRQRDPEEAFIKAATNNYLKQGIETTQVSENKKTSNKYVSSVDVWNHSELTSEAIHNSKLKSS